MKKWLALFKEISKKPAFRIFVTVLILGLLLIKLPFSELVDTISQVSLSLWILALFAFLVGHVFGALKWRIWINTGKMKVPFVVALRCHFAGLFANLFLPSIAGGDVFRAGIAIRYNREKEEVIFGTILDRFLDIIALALIILIGVYFAPESLTAQDRTILSWIFWVLVGMTFGAVLLLTVPLSEKIRGKVRQPILSIRKITFCLLKNPLQSLAGFALSVIIQAGFVVLGALLAGDCGIDLPLTVWFCAWPLAKLFATLPISLGGIGVREVALATILTRFGVSFSKSVSLGLVWESILIAGGCFGGIFYYLMSRTVNPEGAKLENETIDVKT